MSRSKTIKQSFEKGKIYSPDETENVPREHASYFDYGEGMSFKSISENMNMVLPDVFNRSN